MAGHSKFKNIMHRKGAQDAKRAKIFNKWGREISVAARLGGGDPDMNPRLRLAITKAKADNMPNDRIDRAIKSGTGEGDDANYEEIRYEGYGPSGVAIIVDCLTDNRNRSASEVRSTFSKYGGNMGETGSVSFMFDRVGEIQYSKDKASFEEMFEAAVEVGATDVQEDDDGFLIYCEDNDFGDVNSALESKYGEAKEAGLAWKPQNTIAVDEEGAQTLFKLIEMLEDLDDVQSVTANFDISDDIMAKLAG